MLPKLRGSTRILIILVTFGFLTSVLIKGSAPQVPSGTWAPAGSMSEVRNGASAARLDDGRVLVTGGAGASAPLASAELFNNGSFSRAASMLLARKDHAALTLKSGRVLV